MQRKLLNVMAKELVYSELNSYLWIETAFQQKRNSLKLTSQ